MAFVRAVIVALAACWVQACEKYTCKTPDFPLDPSTCGYFDRSSATWFLTPCDHGYVCDMYSSEMQLNGSCVWSSSEFEPDAFPGEDCYYDSDCYFSQGSGLGCVDGVCVGKMQGALCQESSMCNVGLTCINNSCEPQSKEAGVCSSDFDCENNMGCDRPTYEVSLGTCVPYLSVKEGGSVKGCPGSQIQGAPTLQNFNFLCESASCINNPSGGGAVCVAPLLSESALPVNCTTSSQCVANNGPEGADVYSTCSACGYNVHQYTYCSLFQGDPLFKKALSTIQDWFSSDALTNCNTARRFDCITQWSSYEKWAYYYQATVNYAEIAGAESCVAQVLFPFYYAAKQNNAGGWIAAVLAVYSVL